ncbi:MAG: type II toxin-antitoxin system PemK/MazF family toxin [Treponema sp.]|nr:type II toxin-antitoxin system PemK/MazF family toxin [Treponema sp.]
MIRGEIWWAEFGPPYGSEIGYTRPVLIVQDDSFNESRIKTIVVLPLTTNLRLLDAPGNVFIRKKESKFTNDSVIIVAQLYAIDRGRFREKVSKVTKETMEKVKIGMKLVLGMD